MEASPITLATSSSRPRRLADSSPRSARRTSASCWRTVPTRQGTHWPHDSWRKNSAMRTTTAVMSTPVSKAITTPEPRVVPAARASSRVRGRSSESGPTNEPAAPPMSTACSSPDPVTPPARSSTSPSRVPKGTS